MRRIFCGVLALLVLLAVSGCSADISAYENVPIQIVGLENADFSVTPAELLRLDCVSATARGNSDKAGTVHAYGPTLAVLAEHYGHSLDEFRYIRFCASDGYDVTVNELIWDSYEVILSVANGTKPLEQRQQPLRVVIPGYDSGKWVRLVTRIEFVFK